MRTIGADPEGIRRLWKSMHIKTTPKELNDYRFPLNLAANLLPTDFTAKDRYDIGF